MAPYTSGVAGLINACRVAHLATADASGVPHVVPVCFAYIEERFYSVLDRKPKRTPLERLKRVRNIASNPKVCLVVDHYEEDWTQLWYALVTGTARLLRSGREHRLAIGVLRAKYSQYADMDIEGNPVIRITPERTTWWGEPPAAVR